MPSSSNIATLVPGLFSIYDYGAVGDGNKDDGLAIQAAMIDASARGGGVVIIPPAPTSYRLGTSPAFTGLTNVRMLRYPGSTLAGAGSLPAASGTGNSYATVPLDQSGNVQLPAATTITSAASSAFAVGANGSTNPVFAVRASAASVATGVLVTGAAAGNGVTISAITSGTNEALTITSAGTGALNLNTGTSTGAVVIGNATSTAAVTITGNAASTWSVAGAALTVSTTTSGTLTITSAGTLNFSAVAASTWTITGATLTLTIGTALASSYRIGDGTNAYYTTDTRTGITGVLSHQFATTNPSFASAAGSAYTLVSLNAYTWTLTGGVAVTGTAPGPVSLVISSPTITSTSATTVAVVSTAQINGPLATGTGPVTITTAVALDIPTWTATNETTAIGLRIVGPTGAGTNQALAVTGAAVALNVSSNFNTTINTGTSTGTIGIGNSLAGALTIASGAASTITVTSAALTISTATSGTLAVTSAGVLTLTGAAASTWSLSAGALIVQTTSAALTIQTITSGTLAVTSAGALNLTAGAASTWNVTSGSLTLTSGTTTIVIGSASGIITLTANAILKAATGIIGLSVSVTSFTLGTLGSLITPYDTSAGATDAKAGNLDGAHEVNNADAKAYWRVAGLWKGVAIAGFSIPKYSDVPVVAGRDGTYQGETDNYDETICPNCHRKMKPLEKLVFLGDRYYADGGLHAYTCHLECPRNAVV